VRLLQLSSLDFAQEVHDLLGRNPFLEHDDKELGASAEDRAGVDPQAAGPSGLAGSGAASDASSATSPGAALDARDVECAYAQGAASNVDDASGDSISGEFERDAWLADGAMPTRHRDDTRLGALDRVPARASLRDHLHAQIDVLRLALRERALAKAVIEALDDDGYLRQSLADVVAGVALEPAASAAELRVALERVQALEPAGVGARGLAECLLLQLPAMGCPEQRATAQAVLSDHLDRLAARDVAGLARALGREPAHIEAVCERIRHLDPHPGWRFDAAQPHYITPDVIVKKVRGQWSVSLNAAIVPRVRMNQHYARLFQCHRRAHDGELAAHLQEARWAVHNVEQRFATILVVAQAIVKRQRRFFELGPLAMKPMGLREIAGELQLHESTISRVTSNKYMATPRGVFELKYFFSRALPVRSGGSCSATAIRGLIKEMIEAEAHDAPLSDAQLARVLAQQGLVVARRTVTKYRQRMRIAPVARRRTHS
ncbi:MAG: RNA polymerase factor sigma-54, partial [Burkholderiaceae bacterium]